MNNPLKDIFTTKEPELVGSICLKNIESKEKFLKGLNQILEKGEYKEIENISEIETYIKSGGYKQIIHRKNEIDKIFIGLSEAERPFIISTGYGDYTFKIKVYTDNNSIVMETDKQKSIVYIKIVIYNDKKATLNFELKVENANSVKEIIYNLNATKYLIKKMLKNNTNEKEELTNIVNKLECYWGAVSDIENFFGIQFSTQNISEDLTLSKTDEKIILKLYFLFIKKYMIKKNDINSLTIKAYKSESDLYPKIGQKMALSYIESHQQEIYGEKLEFFTQNFITKAIVSKIEEMDNNVLEINVSGTDTEPLNLIYRAYKTKEEIDTTPDLNEINFDDVKTLPELIKEFSA